MGGLPVAYFNTQKNYTSIYPASKIESRMSHKSKQQYDLQEVWPDQPDQKGKEFC